MIVFCPWRKNIISTAFVPFGEFLTFDILLYFQISIFASKVHLDREREDQTEIRPERLYQTNIRPCHLRSTCAAARQTSGRHVGNTWHELHLIAPAALSLSKWLFPVLCAAVCALTWCTDSRGSIISGAPALAGHQSLIHHYGRWSCCRLLAWASTRSWRLYV
jgi:hypothetical protein